MAGAKCYSNINGSNSNYVEHYALQSFLHQNILDITIHDYKSEDLVCKSILTYL